jgi:hypothetical protein
MLPATSGLGVKLRKTRAVADTADQPPNAEMVTTGQLSWSAPDKRSSAHRPRKDQKQTLSSHSLSATATARNIKSPEGLSPPGAPRSVREPVDSYGSRCSAVSMTELPVGEECWIYSAYPPWSSGATA